jgi:CDP-glucose 4,6-dehydratase
MEWKDVNVLVTGASGFVGAWITRALTDEKANVVVLLRDEVPNSPLEYFGVRARLKGIVKGDLVDYHVVERAFNEYEIEACYHLAAQTIVGVANRAPLSTFESNIKGTWNVLEAARNSKVLKKLVVASSDKAYGEHERLPYKEDYPLNALHPYDASKACADILARTYYNTYGLPVCVARCANIYGGGDLNFSRLVPDTIRAVLHGRNPVIRSDGTPVRDYLYIKDAVSAYLTLGEKLERVKGEAFNFGSDVPVSVLELVQKILEISGSKDLKPVIKGKGKPKGEIERQYLSSEKALKLLGWRAKYGLEEGLRETLEWYKAYFASL